MDLLISARKKGYESQGLLLPKLRIGGKMSDLKVSLTPYTYCNITQIHKLFSAEASTEINQDVAKNPLSLDKLKHKASIQGIVSKQEHPLSAPESFFTILHKEMLLFYSNNAEGSSSNGN